MEGLAIGVSHMKSGERSLLHVGWELGYCKEGNFSFPNVPPMADETREGKPRSEMTVEERISAADHRRMDGNDLFKDEKLGEAMQQYEMAIAYMGDDFMFQLFGKYRDLALAVKNPCHLNMAACFIKLRQYEDAIMQCCTVLAEDENNIKALYRRGKARAELGQIEAAREDLLKARKLAPDDKAITRELRLLAEHEKAVYQKQKDMYKGILGQRPEPKPQQTNWYQNSGGEEDDRKTNFTDMVNKYYDLLTSFYEFGWGESFHFAQRWNGESLPESIKRHEHFLALQLDLKPGQNVLDVGCGIGGPLREISRFSSTSVTGLNNNEYQITRAKELNRVAGVDKTCKIVKADFMKMPFPDNSFDAVYAIEATRHAPNAVGCYQEIYRVLKPGQHLAAYEWCMTDAFDPNNQQHQRIKAEIEIGDGLPDIRSTSQCLDALDEAGFEVIWERDLAADSPVPWYLPLDTSHFSLSSFRLTPVGRFFTRNLVKSLELVGLAPEGSMRVQSFLEKTAEGLVDGGRSEIFTPMYFFLARKPASSSN